MRHIEQLLALWAEALNRYALFLALPLVVLSIASLFYVRGNLGVDTETKRMFPSDLPFRENIDRFREEFPHLRNVLLVVVESNTPETARSVAKALSERLQDDEERIADVFSQGADPFFTRHGLLYQDLEELETQADRLAEAQPFLAALMRDPSLRGLSGQTERVIEFRDDFAVDTGVFPLK